MMFCAVELKADLIFKSAGNINKTGPLHFDTNNDGSKNVSFTSSNLTGIGLGSEDPKSNLEIAGSIGMQIQVISANVTLGSNSFIIADTNAAGGNLEITLPDASTMAGRKYFIKKVDDNHTVTLTGNIDNSANLQMTAAANVQPYVELVASGTDWFILDITAAAQVVGPDGPQILTIVADDADNQNHLIDNGDTLVLTFNAETNQPAAATKTEIDSLLNFDGYILGADYTGVWTSNNILTITVVDATGGNLPLSGNITMKANGTPDLKNPLESSDASTDSDIIVGDWGFNLEIKEHIVISQPDFHEFTRNLPKFEQRKLFYFKLISNGITSSTVSEFKLTLNGLNSFANANLDNLKIYVDDNNDGVLADAETTTVGGTGNIDITTNSKITFDTNFNVSDSGNNYFIVGDILGIANLPLGDVATMTMKPDNVTANVTMIGIQLNTTIVIESPTNFGETVYGTTSSESEIPRTRSYDGIEETWSEMGKMATGNATIYWVQNSVNVADNVMSMVMSDNGSYVTLEAQRLYGSNWFNDWSATDMATGFKERRGFDIVHEKQSGEVMVVYSNNSTIPVYRTYSYASGVWSGESNVLGAAPGSDIVVWVELSAKPGTDEIQLIYQDDDKDLFAVTWNGSSWGSASTLTTATETDTVKNFAGAYESLTGDFVVGWGDNNTAGLTFSVRASGNTSFSTKTTAAYTSDEDPRNIACAPDPGSDRIAFVYRAGDNDFEAITWSGTGFVDGRELDGDMSNNGTGDMTVGVAWLATSSQAVAVYDDNNVTGKINWATYDTTNGWVLQTDVSPGGIGALESVELYGYNDLNKVMALISDSNNDLWSAIYDGSNWSLLNSGVALETDLSNLTGVPFHNAVHESTLLAITDHANGQESNLFTGASSFTNGEAFAFGLRPVSGNSMTVTSMRFDLSDLIGVVGSDITDAVIRIDDDGDGVLDAGELTNVGGGETINISETTGTIEFSGSFTVSSANSYFLLLDINNIVAEDQMKIDLIPAGVSSSDATVGGLAASSTHLSGATEPSLTDDFRIVYGIGTAPEDIPFTRIYSLKNDDLTGASATAEANSSIYWVRNLMSFSGNTEVMSILSSAGSSMSLDILQYDGASWSLSWSDTDFNTQYINRRAFDMVMEPLSGNIMVVYTNNASNPSYRYYNGSSWSAEASVFSTAPLSGTGYWVELTAKPGTNELAMGYSDNNRDLASIFWDGSSWVQSTKAVHSVDTRMSVEQCWDMEYETLSGDFIIAWGEEDSDGVYYNTYLDSNGTWSANNRYQYLNDGRAENMRMHADPASDKVAIVFNTNAEWMEGAVWSGGGMVDGRRIEHSDDFISNNGDRLVDIAFVGTSGNALAVYDDNTNSGYIHWILYESGSGWTVKTDFTLPNVLDFESIRLISATEENKVLALISDTAGALFPAVYDNSSWTILNDNTALEDTISRLDSVPFDASVKHAHKILLSDHKVLQKASQFSGTGTLNDVELHAFRLKPNMGSGNTITNLVLNIQDVVGVVQGDISGAEILIDANNDGDIDAGETTAVGGAGTVSLSGSTGTITFASDFTVSMANNYIVRADFANVANGDIFGTSLQSSGLTAATNVGLLGTSTDALHLVGTVEPTAIGDVRVIYGSNDTPAATAKSRVWIESNSAYSPEFTTAASEGTIYWVESAISPIDNSELYITHSVGSNFDIDTFRWDGSNWTEQWDDSNITNNQPYRMYSDVAYESISGNALVVFSRLSNNLKYRHYNATTDTWTGTTDVFASRPISAAVRWVRIEAQPGTNDIALVYSDANNDLAACIWNGDNVSWDEANTEIVLDTNIEYETLRCFDLAYESISGDLVVAWGKRDVDGITYRTLPFGSTTWSAEELYNYTNNGEGRFVQLEADPFTDRIAYGAFADGGHLDLATWTGGQWIDGIRRDYNYPGFWPFADYNFDMAWIGDTGKAVFVFDDQGVSGLINWGYWDPSSNGWQLETDYLFSEFGTLNAVKLYSKMDENAVFGLISDTSAQLYSVETDGSTWTIHESTTPLTNNLSNSEGVPYAIHVKEAPIVIVSDHNVGQVTNALSSGSSVNDATLYAFKLRQKSGTNVIIDELAFELSTITGFVSGDFTDIGIYLDENDNGAWDSGETTQIGGSGTSSISGGSGNFSFTTDIVVSMANNYVLRADVANLVSGDQFSIDFDRTDVNGSGNTVVIGTSQGAGHFKGDFTLSNVGDVRMVYGSSTAPGDKTRHRVFADATNAWSPAEVTTSTGELTNFVEHKISSANVNEEMAAVVYKTASGVSGNVMRWNGSDWEGQFTWDNTYIWQFRMKGVGLAYERMSGNCMVVYAENNSMPKYSYWNGTSWTVSGQDVFSSAPGSAVRAIEVVSRPGTNELALVYYDSGNDIHAIIWDGTQWDETNTEITLETNGRHLWERYFDAEYESVTGDLLVAWGTLSADGVVYATKAADTTTWSSPSTFTWANDRKPLFSDLIADPNSDKIAFVMANDDRWMHGAIWDGENFTEGQRLDWNWNNITFDGFYYHSSAWIGKTGKLISVYDDSDTTDVINWFSWNATDGWTVESDIPAVGIGNPAAFSGDFSHHQSKAVFAGHDEELNLWSYYYDGSNWTFANSGVKLDDEVTLVNGRPFSLVMRQETALILANHKTGLSSDSFSEAGSETNAVIGGFQLYPRETGSHTVTQTIVDLTQVSGIITADLNSAQIVVDTDGDGVIDAGETTTVGGAGTIAISGSSGNIIFNTSYSVSSRTQYLISTNVTSLADKDTLTTSMSEAGMTVSGNTIVYGGTGDSVHNEGVIKPTVNGDLRLVWGTDDSPSNSPRTKVYDKDDEEWGSTGSISGGNASVLWSVNDIAPSGNQELMATFSKDGSDYILNVFSWNGAAWSNDWNSTSMDVVHERKRGFDLAYSQISGNGLVVYSKNDSNLYYRTYSNSTWSSEAAVFATAPGGTVHWVELEARNGSDEIVLVLVDTNRDLSAIMWDGSAWVEDGSGEILEDDVENHDQKNFDAAFESLSGNLMVLWGNRDNSGFYTSTRVPGGTFGAKVRTTYSNDEAARFVDLRSEPGSNRIAVATKAEGNQLELAVWDGSSFLNADEYEHMGWPGNGVFGFALDWVGTTGKIVMVFDDNDDGAGLLNWVTWESGTGWTVQSDISMPTKDYTKGVLAQRVHNEDKVVFVFYDDTGKLFASESDGTTMTVYNNSESLGTVSGIGTSMPLSMALRSQQSLLLANHDDGQEQDAFGEAQAETDAELFSFKLTPSSGVTPTITQVQFRISSIVGLIDGDWGGLEIIRDEDNDGKIEAGETTAVGGAGTVSQASGTITFSSSFTVSSANNYILRGDFASLSTNDSVKIELLPSGFTTQDGEETEGSTTAVTHYENRPAKLAEDDVSVVYGTTSAPADDPRTRIWDDSNDDWDAVTQSAATATTINWTINKLHPQGQIELMGVLSDETSSGNFHMLRWTGSAWAEDWNSTSITSARTAKRGFDIEYESLTGNAIVVYSNNSTIPVYRTYISGNWSGETNVLADTTGTGVVEWVELVRKPGDNEIALVYADSNSDLFSVIWNGFSWDEANTENNLTTNLETITEKCFDAAYETLTGDLLVAWGATTPEGPNFATMQADTFTWSSVQAYDYANDDSPQVLVLKPDPGSDRIAIAMHTDGDDLEAAMWTGSQWTGALQLDGDIGAVNAGELSVGLSWLGDTGTSVLIFNDDGATAVLNWATWTSVQGWAVQTDEAISGMGATHSILTDIFTGTDRMMAVIGDSNDDLWALLYDGTSWEITNTGSALESSMTSSSTVPFSMELRPKPFLIFTEHASNQETDNFTQSGSETGVELFAFQMKSKLDSTQTISQLIFDLSDINGISAGDITNVKLYVDDNKNGAISGGETTTVGGAGSVSITADSGNIVFSTSIAVGANMHYIMTADVASLANEDEITIGLNESGFTMTAGALVVGSVQNATHLEFTVQPLADNDLRAIYGVSSIPENNPRQRTYDYSAGTWSIESLTTSTNGTVKWVESAKSPNTTEEVAVMLSDDGIGTSLDVLRWNGTAWNNDWSTTSIAIGNVQKRAFDVAYSPLSGNAVVVYSDSSINPKYRKLENGVWTSEASVFSTAPGTGGVEWVQLASKPGSEDIALIYADINSDLHSVVWNGSSWDEAGTEQTLETNLRTITQQCFDLSFETLTGDLLVAWGQSGTQGLQYNTLPNGGSWGTSTSYVYVNDEEPERIVMMPDPTSDIIGLLIDASDNDFETAIWLGSSFSGAEQQDNGMGGDTTADDRIAFAWVGSTGKAVFMYDDNDLTGLITWGDYVEGQGWNINNAISVPAMTTIESIKMFGYRNTNRVHALVSDTNFNLFSLEYSDSTGAWTVLNGGNPINSALSTRDSIPFGASVKEEDVLLLASHPQSQELNAFSGSGSETNAELFAFKLMPFSGNTSINVTQVQFDLTLISGLVDADFNGLQLIDDADQDGVIDAGESAVGGTGAVSISGTTGTFTFSSTINLSASKSYILSSNVLNLVTGDTLTIDLNTSGVIATNYASLGRVTNSSHYEGASTVTPNEVNDIRLVYGSLNNPDDYPRTRVWDNATSSWSTVSYASGNAGRKRAIQHELSPTSNEELMAFYTDQGGTLLIEVSRWTGSAWVTDITRTLNDNRHSDKRQFDIAYESMSGDGLFVYSDDGSALYYRTRSGGTWSAETNVFASVPNGNWPLFIQLVSQPGTDRIALVYSDWDNDLHSVIWDGTQWLETDTENEIMTSLVTYDREGFQAAYESLSGDLFICYGNNGTNDGFSIITMAGNTNTWSSIQRWDPAWGQNPQFLRVQPDLFSDHMTCVYKSDGANVEVGIWNGEEMVDISRPEWDADDSDVGDMPVATAWMGSTGNAIAIFKDLNETDKLSWMEYDTNYEVFQHIPHFKQGDIPITGLGEVQSIVARNMTAEKVMVAVSNTSSDLFLITYDGTNWVVTNGGAAIETELSATDAVSFDMAIRRPDILQLGTPLLGREPNALTTTGTVSDAELLGFQLRPRSGGNKTVSQLVVTLNDVVGVADSDITGVNLYLDEDGDGTIDGSESTTYGGAGTVSIVGTTGTITFSTSFDVTSPTNLILQADVANVAALDKFNVDLEPTNITCTANTVVYGFTENSVHIQHDLSLDMGQARLIYGIRDNHYERGSRPISRLWIDDHNDFTEPIPTIDVDYQAKHILHKVHPTSNEELAFMWMSDYVDVRRVQMMRWTGSTWVNDWEEYGGDWDQRYRRGLDIAYCQLSGNAIVVYTDNNEELKYKEWNGSTWTAETEVFPGTPLNGSRVLQIELASKPGSDEIALVYSDAVADLYGLIWDGDEWNISSNVELETRIRTNQEKCFDVAYETLSGELLVAWGRNDNNGIYFSTYTDGAWSSSTRYLYINNSQAEFLDLVPDPASDKIACTINGRDAYLHGAIWLGNSWGYGTRIDFNGWGGAGDFPCAIDWLGTTGKLVGIYDDNTEGQAIHWYTWEEATSWVVETDTPLPNIDHLESVILRSNPHQNKMIGAFLDQYRQLFGAYYDGSSWTLVNGGEPLHTEVANPEGVSFDILLRRPEMHYIADHSQGQKLNQITSTGTQSNVHIFNFRLFSQSGTSANITQLELQLSDVNGIVTGDMTNVRMFIDADNDGVYDSGETQVGGSGLVNISGGTGTVTFSSSFVVSAATDFVCLADFANIADADSVTAQALGTDITLADATDFIAGETNKGIHLYNPPQPDDTGDIRITYGTLDSPRDIPRTRFFDDVTDDLTSTELPFTSGETIFYMENRLAIGGNTEYTAVFTNDGTRKLTVGKRTDATWNVEWSTTNFNNTGGLRKGFDMELSAISDNAMVVWSDEANDDIYYRSNHSGSWSAEQVVFSTKMHGTDVDWVELVAKPGSDEFALVYSDDSRDLFAAIWDGTQWLEATKKTLETNLEVRNEKCFDAAYETLSGNLLVAWGRGGTDGLHYSIMPQGNNTWSQKYLTTYSNDNEPRMVRLIPDPASNQIAYAGRAEGDHMEVGMWDGYRFMNIRRFDWMGSPGPSKFYLDGAWVGSTGEFVVVYDDGITQDVMNWVSYNRDYRFNENWFVEIDSSVPGAEDTISVDLETNLSGNNVVASISDLGQNLWVRNYDGTAWTTKSSGTAIENNISSVSTHPFDLTIKSKKHLVVANHIAGQTLDIFSGNTSVTGGEFFRFKLIPARGSHTVTNLVISLDDVVDVLTADCSNAKLYVDTNNDGTIGAGETTTVGGNGTVNISVGTASGTITFTDDFSLNAITNYVLTMDMINIDTNDQLAIELNPHFVSTSDVKDVTGFGLKTIHRKGHTTLADNGDMHLYYGSFPYEGKMLKKRHFDISGTDWTSQFLVSEASAPPLWVVAKKSPTNANEEIIAMMTRENQDLTLEVFRFDGTNYTRDWIDTGYGNQYRFSRGFDVAYEKVSGNCMITYMEGQELRYRTWDGSSWSSEGTVFSTKPNNSNIRFVELSSHPTTNEMTVAFNDQDRDLFSVKWTGSTWDEANTEKEHHDNIRREYRRGFDLAYCQVSGNLLVAWSPRGDDGIDYSTRDNGSNTWVDYSRYTYSNDNRGQWLDLSPDPASNKIACVVETLTNGEDLEAAMWDGDAWTAGRELDGYMRGGYDGDAPIAVTWVGDTGEAIIVYDDDDLQDEFRWTRWDGSAWENVQTNVPLVGMKGIESVQLINAVDSDKAFLMIYDEVTNLYIFTYDGSSWVNTSPTELLIDYGPSDRTQPFGATVKGMLNE